ncbi:MAG: hypothetical protein VXV95_02235, partial [Candidatus Thermoplasmatota archaeon]|nr:hypothetical protein [Candidatus Thermoplasmatota archaeon]
INSTSWGEVLQPVNSDGWCSKNSNTEEIRAFQATLLMLPKNTNLGVACPDFAGASATQPPQANELIWFVYLDSSEKPVDWTVLNDWCDQLSENTEFIFEPAGVNMLFKEAEEVAKQDLRQILPITGIILFGLMLLFFRNLKVTTVTLGSVILVVTAVIGLLQTCGYDFSVIDGIAVPIIMGVAVDGAFWYKSSNKPKAEVRKILLLAMATTVAAVSLALVSPIKAQRGLALVMILGIIIDWVLTRFVLEEFYLLHRKEFEVEVDESELRLDGKNWLWPGALTLLVLVALTSPTGVEALDIEQFLPEDSESLDELDELRDIYVIASGTIVFITLDIDTADPVNINNILSFRSQFNQHPNIISFDSGLVQQNLILGIGDTSTANFLSLQENTTESVILTDPWLRVDGEIIGGMIIAIIDGEDSESAYQFMLDTQQLIDENQLSGEIGGELITGINLAKSFEQTRVIQILCAGLIVFIISLIMTYSVEKSLRISIGTIAVGIAIDGLASYLGGRGVNTAPAVLLGMGFAADYLSHASEKITSWRLDNYARWGAAVTSGLVFFAVSFSEFPPAKDTGLLLSLTILISVFLATCLSIVSSSSELQDNE